MNGNFQNNMSMNNLQYRQPPVSQANMTLLQTKGQNIQQNAAYPAQNVKPAQSASVQN